MLTVKELAKILKVSPKTVYKLIYEGKIPVYYKFGRAIRFDEEEIKEWIEQCRVVNSTDGLRIARRKLLKLSYSRWSRNRENFDQTPKKVPKEDSSKPHVEV